MKVVFCGSSDFSVPSLRACIDEHDVRAVVTRPDKPGSRGRPAPRPVADVARESDVPLLQPSRLRDEGAQKAITACAADALVVAAYGQIIPAPLLQAHRFGGVNVHASLLPRWRGASPIAAAIIAGDEQTGVSIMQMEAGLDTGPVYRSEPMPIAPDESTPQLEARLAVQGAALLLQVLEELEAGSARAEPQDPEAASYAPLLRREDGFVVWGERSAAEIDRLRRGLQPWPGVSVPLDGEMVRLCAGRALAGEAGAKPGAIVGINGEAVDVATAGGIYRILEVQPPGKRPMSAAAYLRGRRR